jgi:hypothetical protein
MVVSVTAALTEPNTVHILGNCELYIHFMVWVSNWSYRVTIFSVVIIHCLHTVINIKVSTFDYMQMDYGFKESGGSAG